VPSPAQDSGNDAQLADGPGDSERVGTAPNGQPLYAAEWYREPTNQELSTYLPPRMPDGGGWGLVACKTIARYHVDDCVELGNSPPGSHLASAVRQAAWQFLVRPPRKGGREMVGEWVRIRIDYLQGTRTRVE
jgi:protein TonB